ncbi:MAG: right-handed parallel beta-helix repeat-containing protein [Candidatus Bipolaricaulota bacterium]|nr:right-handed parallel beta-helix repeat-containing protein [Candidatus Bipolaricaulota bacterium]
MKRLLVFLLIVGAALAVSVAALGGSRGAIAILGEAEFTAENGVVSGSGTEADPYVITGWEISADGAKYAVKIENVTAHFVLRGLIIQSAVAADGAAIRIAFSSGGRIEQCAISNSMNGIEIISSREITVTSCVLYVNGVGLRVIGEEAAEYHHDIDRSNTVNNRPILYVYGADGVTIEGEAPAHLTVADSRNVVISGNDLMNSDGIQLAFVTDSVVSGNAVYRTTPVLTEHGIFLFQSDRNTLQGNSLRNNRLAGIQMTTSSDNQVLDNQCLANDTGIRLIAADGNHVSGNVVFANANGIIVSGGSDENELSGNILYHKNTKQGITLELASANRVVGNGLSDCEIGISLSAQATGNEIVANTIVSGGYGIALSGSENRIEGNLIAQQSRGLLFPEAYGRSTAAGNDVVNNVFTDNGNHVYVNLDSKANRFARNVFLGVTAASVLDYGTGNVWTIDGVGNFWQGTPVIDADGNGIGESAVTVYPSTAQDTAPLASVDAAAAGFGVAGAMGSDVVTIVRADGSSVDISVRVAADDVGHWTGFRGFPGAYVEAFSGILFPFDTEAERRFTMSTVLFDLEIAFFAADGTFVGAARMAANSGDLYAPSAPFQFALELPVGSIEGLRIAAGSTLVVP